MASFGIAYVPPAWDIVLPVGISFYTFATLSYTLDVYLAARQADREVPRLRAVRHLLPAPGGGPDRAPDASSCRSSRRRGRRRATRFCCGLGADDPRPVPEGRARRRRPRERGRRGVRRTGAGRLRSMPGSARSPSRGQIFCDFAGYSTAAIGASLCLGFALPDNFRFPYAAIGFSDFWRRWHISLSTWLRDYLYIPLGGNRGSEVAHLRQPDADDAARRPLARRQLDLRRLGRPARPLSFGRALGSLADRRRGRPGGRLEPPRARRC